MRNLLVVSVVVLGVMMVTNVHAGMDKMLGTWKNVDADTRGVTRLRIYQQGRELLVQAWGKAHPRDIVIGPFPAEAYAPSAGSNLHDDAEAMFAEIQNDFSIRRFLIRPDRFGRLNVRVLVRFTDSSNRTPYHNLHVFERMQVRPEPRRPRPERRPHPFKPVRPGRLRPGRIENINPGVLIPKEDLIEFDWRKARVKQVNGRYKILVDSMWLKDFGTNRSEAWQALRVIRRYRLNRQGFVGRPDPSMEYYLGERGTPEGEIRGEDAIAFNPARLEVKEIGGRFKIVEGRHWLMDFEGNEAEARLALAIIKRHGFTHQCYVGRPNASFKYFRK